MISDCARESLNINANKMGSVAGVLLKTRATRLTGANLEAADGQYLQMLRISSFSK